MTPVAIALCLVLGACQATPAPLPSSSPPPVATPTPSTPEQIDKRGAEQALVSYAATLDRLRSDPSADVNAVWTVAKGDAGTTWVAAIGSYRERGWRQTGTTVVVNPVATVTGQDRWSGTACIDVSQVDVLDRAGTSVVRTDRKNRIGEVYTVVKEAGSFYVTTVADSDPC